MEQPRRKGGAGKHRRAGLTDAEQRQRDEERRNQREARRAEEQAERDPFNVRARQVWEAAREKLNDWKGARLSLETSRLGYGALADVAVLSVNQINRAFLEELVKFAEQNNVMFNVRAPDTRSRRFKIVFYEQSDPESEWFEDDDEL